MHAVHFYILPFAGGEGPPRGILYLPFERARRIPIAGAKGSVTGWGNCQVIQFGSGWDWGKGLVLRNKISFYGEQGDDEDL